MNNEFIRLSDAVEILRARAEMATGTPKSVFFAAADMIEKLPAVDAVQVVRCRDCKWWVKLADYMPGLCASNLKWTAENWYCASGEIKEAESDV